MSTSPISVKQLNFYVKSLLESSVYLQDVSIVGEISNFTNHYKSGHFYLTLKDDKATVKAVMFRTSASKLAFMPQDGMRVICSGRVSLFERDGSFQVYVEHMFPDGVGSIRLAFEQLKAKLAAQGLFDPAHKKPIPKYPKVIGIVTSSAGAAVHDMIRILRRRYPIAKVILLPVRVQGVEAPPEIAGAIRYANRFRLESNAHISHFL